jgi:hypothetical protein
MFLAAGIHILVVLMHLPLRCPLPVLLTALILSSEQPLYLCPYTFLLADLTPVLLAALMPVLLAAFMPVLLAALMPVILAAPMPVLLAALMLVSFKLFSYMPHYFLMASYCSCSYTCPFGNTNL